MIELPLLRMRFSETKDAITLTSIMSNYFHDFGDGCDFAVDQIKKHVDSIVWVLDGYDEVEPQSKDPNSKCPYTAFLHKVQLA